MHPAPDISAPSLPRSIATGAIGFAVVSLCVFATVAFGEGWMYRTLGLAGSYLAWVVLFVVLSGAVFGSLVVVRWRLPKFYLLWTIGFIVYVAAWILAYFTVGRTTGEVIGSIAGSISMAVVLALGFSAPRSIVKLSAVIFVGNALGYFLGSALFDSFRTQTGMLLFGVVYGVFFGAGIAAALHIVQLQPNEQAT